MQARGHILQPCNNEGLFSSDFGPFFSGFVIKVPSGCLGESSVLKITTIDDAIMWSKFEPTW